MGRSAHRFPTRLVFDDTNIWNCCPLTLLRCGQEHTTSDRRLRAALFELLLTDLGLLFGILKVDSDPQLEAFFQRNKLESSDLAKEQNPAINATDTHQDRERVVCPFRLGELFPIALGPACASQRMDFLYCRCIAYLPPFLFNQLWHSVREALSRRFR